MKTNKTTQILTPVAVGAAVIVKTAATNNTEARGEVTAFSKGWYVVALADPSAFPLVKTGKVSVRRESLFPTAVVSGYDEAGDAGEYDDEADESDDEIKPGLLGGLVAVLARNEGLEPDYEDLYGDEESDDGELTVGQKMALTLAAARVRYTKAKNVSGSVTATCNDDLARAMLDYDPVQVALFADAVLALPRGTHYAKYGHLNRGQIRMNSGNRIRAIWKKAEGDVLAQLRIAVLFQLEDAVEALLALVPEVVADQIVEEGEDELRFIRTQMIEAVEA